MMLHYATTGLLALFLLWSASTYVFSAATIAGIQNLGFPDHFRWQLVVLKLIAVLVLIVPAVPIQVKEWAYAGVALFLLTAIVAHVAHGDPWFISLLNVVVFVVLVVSNMTLIRH